MRERDQLRDFFDGSWRREGVELIWRHRRDVVLLDQGTDIAHGRNLGEKRMHWWSKDKSNALARPIDWNSRATHWHKHQRFLSSPTASSMEGRAGYRLQRRAFVISKWFAWWRAWLDQETESPDSDAAQTAGFRHSTTITPLNFALSVLLHYENACYAVLCCVCSALYPSCRGVSLGGSNYLYNNIQERHTRHREGDRERERQGAEYRRGRRICESEQAREEEEGEREGEWGWMNEWVVVSAKVELPLLNERINNCVRVHSCMVPAHHCLLSFFFISLLTFPFSAPRHWLMPSSALMILFCFHLSRFPLSGHRDWLRWAPHFQATWSTIYCSTCLGSQARLHPGWRYPAHATRQGERVRRPDRRAGRKEPAGDWRRGKKTRSWSTDIVLDVPWFPSSYPSSLVQFLLCYSIRWLRREEGATGMGWVDGKERVPSHMLLSIRWGSGNRKETRFASSFFRSPCKTADNFWLLSFLAFSSFWLVTCRIFSLSPPWF